MIWANDVRSKARVKRDSLGLGLADSVPGEQVLNVLLQATGFTRNALPHGDPLLMGALALLDRDYEAIYEDKSLPANVRCYNAAHEFAHLFLHGTDGCCGEEDLGDPSGADPIPLGEGKVEGYSPRQRREAEANVYAAEILLPRPLAVHLFENKGFHAGLISAELGLPLTLVYAQLQETMLLPEPAKLPPFNAAKRPPSTSSLDLSQAKAAQATGPLLVSAGPGTGKTKTLVGRCVYLTKTCGIAAENILALTFSNKAAQEMRERLLVAGVGTENAGPWVGTFHSFGLDVLRQFGERIGLIGNLKLLDRVDQIALLENNLIDLQLEHLENLHSPATAIARILTAISRAKDEGKTPDEYEQLVRAVPEPDNSLLEVAHCYHVYERLMATNGFLDFGDLIMRTVRLFHSDFAVAAKFRERYPYVLADEYQDVNRVSAKMIRLLAGEDAAGLWVVGDERQSIYRFRGASPANIAGFKRDYPTSREEALDVNYRSLNPIVGLFSEMARAMAPVEERGDLQGWTAERGATAAEPGPVVSFAEAPDADSQAAGIVEAMAAAHRRGYSYRDQAILCRSHSQAAELCDLLTRRGARVLYLGDLLERTEIKDLLCVLSLCGNGDNAALLRVSAFPEYAVPQADCLKVLGRLQEKEAEFLAAMQSVMPPHGSGLLDGVSEAACNGLVRLAAHLQTLAGLVNPAQMLKKYLFGLSRYLHAQPADETHAQPADETHEFLLTLRGMAIYQLLQLAGSYDKRLVKQDAGDRPLAPVDDFIGHLRRLHAEGELLRGVSPDGAQEMDAVRVLTVHAAKGLEFPVVFLPNLGTSQWPATGGYPPLPVPPGMVEQIVTDMDEENCLFFVALSRAKDRLVLSRCTTSPNGNIRNPSRLWTMVLPWLQATGSGPLAWGAALVSANVVEEAVTAEGADLGVHAASDLDKYMQCPQKYYLAKVLGLKGQPSVGADPKLYKCLYSVLDWLAGQWQAGNTPGETEIAEALDKVWATDGPTGHAYAAKHKDAAIKLLQKALPDGTEVLKPLTDPFLTLTFPSCRIRTRPQSIGVDPAGTVIITRYKMGKPKEADQREARLALVRHAAAETHPGQTCQLQLRYLRTGKTIVVEPPNTKVQINNEWKRARKYEEAAVGVALGRFAPDPESANTCKSCPYVFVCPKSA